MIKLGLCCKWHEEPIKFKSTTVKKLYSLPENEKTEYLKLIINNNIKALEYSIERCAQLGIGAFRVMSGFFPCSTHPDVGYDPLTLSIRSRLHSIGYLAIKLQVKLINHPSQYIVMNSPEKKVVAASIRDLVREADLMDELHSPYVIIHGGGGYGDKKEALKRLKENLEALPRPC